MMLSEYERERYDFNDLREIMERLRAPGGCPWDAEQTMDSIRRYLLEETHELIEAIEDEDLRGICEECGDVLLQVVFLSAIASEQGLFRIDDVTDGICRKLIRRHPHVFGDTSVKDTADVLNNWEKIKVGERALRKSDSSAIAGVPRSLPGLLRAYRIQERAARAGFDWEFGDVESVRSKVLEELDELRAEVECMNRETTAEELGDLIFAVVNMSRHLDIDPESALQGANAKFSSRFRSVEEQATKKGVDMRALPLEELDIMWNIAKEYQKSSGSRGE